ncbi:MAG: choice-of-anchor Q domain-containing protein [Rhodanobacteraceae bacterium]
MQYRVPFLLLLVGPIALCTTARDASAQADFDCVAPIAPNPANPLVLGNGTPGSVTTAMIQNALDAGGAIRINAGASTIAVDATLIVTRETILDLGGATLSGGGARRVLEVRNPSNLTYTFALQDGAVVAGSTPGGSGAALFKDTGGPWQVVTIRIFDVDFNDNHAIAVAQDGGGGAVYVVGAAEISVVGANFNGNSGANGGALYSLVSQRVNLHDSAFVGNVATGSGGNPGNGGNGGAVGVDGGVDNEPRFLNLCRVRLIANQSNAFGAGIFTVTYSGNSFTRIRDSTLQANVSVATDKLAGGAYLQGSPIEISGSTFRDNAAAGYAGLALFGYGGVLNGRIVNSTFVGNVARTGLGGAMSIAAADSLLLENLTIAQNSAPCDVCFAAGIANDSGDALTMRNVIFENNIGGNAYNPWAMLHPAAQGAANLQWPEVREGSGQSETPVAPGTVFASADAAAPAANGGPTETMAISAASPAFNAGTATGAPATDQRGFPRNGAVDIGAFEVQGDAIFDDGFDGAD